MTRIIILRPEPGASQTAQAARTLGFDPHVHSLFAPSAIDWIAPAPSLFDALLFTSAHGARFAAPGLSGFHAKPAYAVGDATAQALRDTGFRHVVAGNGDGSAIAARIVVDGYGRVLHPGGTTIAPMETGTLDVTRLPVYAMTAVDPGPGLLRDADAETILLVHSPRAGEALARHLPASKRTFLHLVAISPTACAAAGEGWASAQASARPRDDDMLALAVRLCEDSGEMSGKGRNE